ncbi:unnamed protein product, partial [Symbiodinium microadriaticum]
MAQRWALQIIYVDDLHVVVVGLDRFKTLWLLLAAYEVAGTPFNYAKFKGGHEAEFVGYFLSYYDHRAGISERRCRWVLDWIASVERDRWMVLGRNLAEFVGRMTFVGRLLGWIVLGGWSLMKGLDPKQADWFAVELRPSDCPWLFGADGESKQHSTSAELLASYVAVVVFGHLREEPNQVTFRVILDAGTDNKSAPQAQKKGYSTKWPLFGVLMQMVSELAKNNKLLRLSWRPREQNQEADDLTNLQFDKFDVRLRKTVCLADVPLAVVHDTSKDLFEVFALDPACREDLLYIAPGAWQSAESQPDIVAELLKEELAEGWISEFASLADVQAQFPQVALGRLGLVLAEGRSAHLVVDSSVTGVTASSSIPNCVSNPRIEDVSSCAPTFVPKEPWIGASIDVKKAHRRMKVNPPERALLAFSFRGRYFISNCLNFGARASAWYWSRLAGSIHRLSHQVIFLRHFMWVYVDDWLAAFVKAT